jgi:sulfur relay (sulfurtransferase) DsrF/TusC family protein
MPIVLKCGSLSFLVPSGPVQPVMEWLYLDKPINQRASTIANVELTEIILLNSYYKPDNNVSVLCRIFSVVRRTLYVRRFGIKHIAKQFLIRWVMRLLKSYSRQDVWVLQQSVQDVWVLQQSIQDVWVLQQSIQDVWILQQSIQDVRVSSSDPQVELEIVVQKMLASHTPGPAWAFLLCIQRTSSLL